MTAAALTTRSGAVPAQRPAPVAELVDPHRDGRPTGRSSAVDAVRVLATATVVLAHGTSDHRWAHLTLFSWHVPVFCVLSGYLWSSRRSFGTEVRRRARSLLVPYLSWLLLVTAFWVGVEAHRGDPVRPGFYADLVRGGTAIVMPYSPYWFITALFVACLVARLLRRPGAIALVGLLGLVATGTMPRPVCSVWWAAGLALPCLAFLAAGMLLREHRPRIRHPLATGATAVLTGALLIAVGVEPLNLKAGDLGTPGLGAAAGTAIAVGLVLLAEGLFVGTRHRIRWVSALATTAMPVVLGHTLVLGVLAERPSDAPAWVIVTAVTAPWLGGLLLARTPVLRRALL